MSPDALLIGVKLLHTLIFAVMSACVAWALYSGVVGRIGRWTWIALGVGFFEGAVLVSNGWRCPLTDLAASLGATNGDVAGIFLPAWLAENLFSICTPVFTLACVLVIIRATLAYVRSRS